MPPCPRFLTPEDKRTKTCALLVHLHYREIHYEEAPFARPNPQGMWDKRFEPVLRHSRDLSHWVHRSSWQRSSRKVCLLHSSVTGQAGGTLHTMAVLQSYQADLLKGLDWGQGLSPEAVADLRRTTDLALRANKPPDSAIGRSMAAMVATMSYLNLADIREKMVNFLLDAQVLPSELFRASIEMIVGRFSEVGVVGGFQEVHQYMPGGPGPSQSEDWRQG